ncbi:hypothetical protein WJX72_010042 [[Myrmecia] bisecta]|uniref:Spermatogenesis-associated protein 17 n=1 Tax=[Myrmecia] bisecta TaxID=41462 RepID=A0AAW1Q9W7_9CHLO
MAAIARLKAKAPEVVVAFLENSRQAEAARPRDTAAAIRIQAAIRSYIVRHNLRRLTQTVICIQRCWRGYVGRQWFKHCRRIADKQLRKAYFDVQATQIQRHWRGFYSRKYVHDFGARKAYLATIASKNAQIREYINAEFQTAVQILHKQEEEEAQARFAKRVIKLHHLLSTEAQAGVFRSPYAAVADTLPAVAGVPLETHIKDCTKASMKAWRHKHLAKHPFLPSITHAHHKGAGRKLTIRASERYAPDAAKESDQLDVKLHRHEVLERHGSPFLTTATMPEPFVKVPPMRSSMQYNDPMGHAMGIHTATQDAQMLRISRRQFTTSLGRQHYFDD